MSETARSRSVTVWMQTAKAKAIRVAGERSSIMQSMMETAKNETQRTSMLLGLVKAKAQNMAEAAAAAAASATTGTAKDNASRGSSVTSKRSACRPQSRRSLRMSARKLARVQRMSKVDGQTTPSKIDSETKADESHIESLTKAGWSPVAARLAMCRSGGGVKDASNWLADEANTEEILAVEAAEMWAAEMLESRDRHVSSPPVGCTEDFLAVERCLFDGTCDDDDDDGYGLGMGRPQSPRCFTFEKLDVQVPESPSRTAKITVSHSPGLYSRLYQKQEESDDVHEAQRPDSQKQEESKDVRESGKPDASAAPLTATTWQAYSSVQRLSDATTQASVGQSNLEGCSEDEQEDGVDEILDAHEELALPEPPDGGSWEWPLTRNERKARILLLDRQMNQLEKKTLIQALIRNRMSSRAAKE
eukprot:TRINITY_DN2436_c0_g1_i1.p1 TRINITY_DN2436_c0_g1~~TRINITY_DN2436_c0_g1_i1.p1  ORF type:complete len:419 (+),score=92.01 TRINITY_DN2436_c0_g1_i1:156-1412(+)